MGPPVLTAGFHVQTFKVMARGAGEVFARLPGFCERAVLQENLLRVIFK
jgi:hypothetical protein